MKTSTLVTALLIGLAGLSVVPAETKAQHVSVNFSVFQNELSRYGRWMHSPRYGQVWIYNEPGFRPYYTNGYWDYTDFGWAWVSNYDWGWAPFHYGRWELDPMYGWIWIPGYDWAPAWVSWSESGDYYGWAPLGYGVNINISIGAVPYDRWVFCSRPYMNSPRFRDYCAPFGNNRVIVRNTTIINNIYRGGSSHRYYSGPGRGDVERYSRSRIEPRRIDDDRRFRNRNWGNDNRGYAERNTRPDAPDTRRFDNRNNNQNDYGRNPDNNIGRNRNGRQFENRPFGNNERNRDVERNRDINRGRELEQNRENQHTPARPDNDVRRQRPERNRTMRENPGGQFGQNNGRRQQEPSPQATPDRPRGFEQRGSERQRDRSDIGQRRFENRNNGNTQERNQGNGNGNGRGRERRG
jgi:hypothetical protein